MRTWTAGLHSSLQVNVIKTVCYGRKIIVKIIEMILCPEIDYTVDIAPAIQPFTGRCLRTVWLHTVSWMEEALDCSDVTLTSFLRISTLGCLVLLFRSYWI